jgi:hypothetical protein
MKLTVTDKEIVQDVLSRMPDEASLHDIAQELEFIAAVRHGLAEFDENKDSISIEAVKRELPSWSVTVGRQRRVVNNAHHRQLANNVQNEKQVTR